MLISWQSQKGAGDLNMPHIITYVNLKAGETEEDLISNLARYDSFCGKRIKGWGGFTVYRHYYFGENRRQYQICLKFDNLSVIDAEIRIKTDPEIREVHDRLMNIMDAVNHIDECVSEVYPKREPGCP